LEGTYEGDVDGVLEGATVGDLELDGATVGHLEGATVGDLELDGATVGHLEGATEGVFVGPTVGEIIVGANDGVLLGETDGETVGVFVVTVEEALGILVGGFVGPLVGL
jgi:hypothetical protein